MYVDVHCHLDHPWLTTDLAKVVERARQAGIKAIITNGVDPASNRKTIEIAKTYPLVKPALGIYPIQALQLEMASEEYPGKHEPFDVDEEIKWILKQRPTAIGEVGMDFNVQELKTTAKSQEEVFAKMIKTAVKLKVPVMVHSRKAEQEAIDVLESSSAKKVDMHCFGGRLKLAKRIADNGWYLSIPTSITRSSHFQRMVEEIALSQLLTETDAPYQSPVFQQRNEPAFIPEAVRMIARIKKIEVEETAKNIFMNYQKLF